MTRSNTPTSNTERPDVLHGEPRPGAAIDSERALQAASRIRGRRKRLQGAPLADLVATIHEGHRH